MKDMNDKFDIDDDDIRVISRKSLSDIFSDSLGISEKNSIVSTLNSFDATSRFNEPISSERPTPPRLSIASKSRRSRMSFNFFKKAEDRAGVEDIELDETALCTANACSAFRSEELPESYVEISYRSIFKSDMTIFTPHNAEPSLEIGLDFLVDPTVVLACRALDSLSENAQTCSAIVSGELVGGIPLEAGYCCIIDGRADIGMGIPTGKFEEALTREGDFFRQLALVYSGHAIVNRSRYRKMKRALIKLDGRLSVISSSDDMTFDEFACELMDMGVSEAVSISSEVDDFLFYVDKAGKRHQSGKMENTDSKPALFLVWRSV